MMKYLKILESIYAVTLYKCGLLLYLITGI